MMEEVIKAVVEKFEGFIKRSVLPSASFMLFFLIFDITLNENKITIYLDKNHSHLTISLFILAFIGLTNLLSVLQQAVYDNQLKGNFNGTLFWTGENEELDKLRMQVNEKLQVNKKDYALYQIIGKSMEIKKEYVDQAKSFGIMTVSLIIITFIYLCTQFTSIKEFSFFTFIITLISLVLEYLVGLELVTSRYRSRAKRIYLNYLNEKSTSKKLD